jgi:prophage endopeptidase
MNRTEFIVATAVVLFVAFALGWFLHWLVNRFSPAGSGEVGDLDRMAQALHEAEEERDAAIAWARQRETELSSRLGQSQAELAAAMEGLREARSEAEELRGYIERANRAR